GLQEAEFARLGGIHRNTFINSPKLLDATLRLKAAPHLRFAGQMTGCEGYVESAAIGLLAACFTAADVSGATLVPPPSTTAHGALLAHITGGHLRDEAGKRGTFQPMNVNFGLFPPVEAVPTHVDGKRLKGKEKTRAKKREMAARALRDFAGWISATGRRAAA
ncbi:MAG TPA: FAD-dependent oxidoreductase, partial [Afifellaceae bacterium]|nr:FAD-dependent oxidoreductase [Afifellaceae bacterium]